MKLGSRPKLARAMATAVTCLLGVALAAAQVPTAAQTNSTQKPVMAEDVLKNVQVLKGIPLDEFMGTMGFFSAALDLNCVDCHVPEATGTGGGSGDFSKYADDTPMKVTARKMILMVRGINKNSFAGQE